MGLKKALWLFSLFAINLVEQPAPDVTIKQGTLSGKISPDGMFFEYLGIPYGIVNGTNRFQEPYPAPSWEGTLRAVDEHHACPRSFPLLGYYGNEDCLKVNVYVPAKADKPLAVMVYIHGGAFHLGTGGKMLYAPDFLIKKDVIVVTFNYRLGVLGFLCLHIEEAPGNAGLRDQVAALRWVKRNIAAFGGDPDNITIFGGSAGAVSTSLMVASKATDKLFERAIMSSGASTSHWAINREPLKSASYFAKHLGYDTDNPYELYKVFSQIPLEKLAMVKINRPLSTHSETELLHIPCVEKIFPNVEPIIDDLPYNLIRKYPKNISIIHGSNNKEGLFLLPIQTDEMLNHRNVEYAFSSDLEIEDQKQALNVSKTIKDKYFGGVLISKNNLFDLTQYFTDLYFEIPTILESELLLESNKLRKVFNYYFKYSGGRNFFKILFGFGDEIGACHADETFYIFKGRLWPFFISEDDLKIIDLMTTMWSNFAKYDHPTAFDDTKLVKWVPSSKEKLEVLYIDQEPKMGQIPNPKNYYLWKDLYEKYRKTVYF